METGAAVPDGERGELVVTTLGRPGMPVVRYRTGDLVVRTTEPCPCGRHLARLVGGVLGRADDMLIVRGVNVFPSAVDNLVRQLSAIVEYEVEVRRVEALDELTVKVETAPGASFDEVRGELAAAFRSRLGIRVDVVEAAAGTLPRYELKAKRFRWARGDCSIGVEAVK